MGTKFTEKAENALNKAVKLAEGFGHTYVGSEHILLSISMDDGCCGAGILKKRKISSESLEQAIRKTTGIGNRTKLTSKDTTPRCRRILESSYKIAKKYCSEKIGTEHILYAILDEGESVAEKILLLLNIDIASLKDDVHVFLKTSLIVSEISGYDKEQGLPNLLKYGINMVKRAELEQYDPVIGRNKETERLIRILTRKNKNNPCLIGEPGVGKTAIVEGLAKRIACGAVPPQLKGKLLISLDLSSMVAGAKYRGDFEERIKNILNEAAKNKSVILFIDEIHTIVGAGSAEGAIDAANIMKPQLSRGDIRVIGATTISEYRKYIEKDGALERRFQPIIIEEPDEIKTAEILHGIKNKYESYYNLNISDKAIDAAIDLSKKYIHDRRFPDKAIDLLDEACAMVTSKVQNDDKSLFSLYNLGQNVGGRSMMLDDKHKYFSKTKLYNKAKEDNFTDLDLIVKDGFSEDYKDNDYQKSTVLEDDVKSVAYELFSNPKVMTSEKPECLRKLLRKRVYGQEKAIDEIISAVAKNIIGICDDDRPLGIFLFVGESGVGKTELAKAMCEGLYGNEEYLVTLDMSEYSEQSAVSKIIGSAPGYVGYDEDNSILERIRRHPYSVLLLDEIDKAHSDVIALFLQVFDSASITDSAGRKISFRNTYIIMTSNKGENATSEKIGFVGNNLSLNYYEVLKNVFSSEFLNRIDAIIPFSPLGINALSSIAEIQLEERVNKLFGLGYHIEIGDGVVDYLAKMAKKNGGGARSLKRMVSSSIDSQIATIIASGQAKTGDIIKVYYISDCDDEKIIAKVELSNALAFK